MYPYFNKLTRATFFVAVYLQFLLPVAGFAATITSANNNGGTGAWSDTLTWVGRLVPMPGDAVTITVGTSVMIDADVTLQSLTISGMLTFENTTARNVTISNNVIIDNTGTFQTGSAGSITTHALSVGGDLTNNGVLDFSTYGNRAGAGLTFTGASDNTFGGNGGITDILILGIDKGGYTLTLNPAVFTVKGSSSSAPAFLSLMNGTIHIAGNYTFSSVVTSGSIVWGSSCGFWLDNPTFTVSTTNSVEVNGLFKLTRGIFNVGTSGLHSLTLTSTTNFVISGGILNVASRLKSKNAASPLNFTMSGGIINVCTVANTTSTPSFSVNAKNFTMSGGQIVLKLSASGSKDYFASSTVNMNITGGTLICSTIATGAFKISGTSPAITLEGSATLENDLSVNGNITINNGATLNLNNYTLYLDAGDIINNGTIQAPFTALNNNSQLWMNAMTNQIYSGTGNLGTSTEPIAALAVNNENTFSISSSSSNLYINTLYIYAGNVSVANKLTIGNSIGLASLIQYGDPIPTGAGILDDAPNFNIGSGGLNVLYASETTTGRVTGFEIPANRTINKLMLSGNTVSLSGGDLNVSSFLQFSSGKIHLGNNNLILESNVSVTGANNNGYVVTNGTGRLTRKGVGGVNQMDFPVGTTTSYDPASITNAGTTDEFSVNVSSTLDAFSPMPNKYLQRQWNISEATTGGSNVTLSLTCAAGVPTNNFDAAGAVQIGHYKSPNVWERIPATMSNSVATANNITSFSPFVIINQNAVLPVELVDFKGVANGKQNNISWSTASERDTKGFILERRNNYGDFKSLDLVAATGQSNQPQFYQWVDHAPAPLSMYRLKIIDLNGSYEYSKVVSIENAGGNAMTILSNLTSDDLTIRLSDVPIGESTISIFDMQGKLQYVQKIDIQNSTTDVKLSINNLPNGSYVFVCNVTGQILSKKWVKI